MLNSLLYTSLRYGPMRASYITSLLVRTVLVSQSLLKRPCMTSPNSIDRNGSTRRINHINLSTYNSPSSKESAITPGKRSPDGKFLEYAYNREIATRIVADLTDRGYNAQLLVPETEDIPLSERVRRINAHCNTFGKPHVILISIHVNAAGNGSQWLNATGWSVFTCSGQTESDRLAECLCQAAIKNFPVRRIRTYFSDGDSDWEDQFYILRKSWRVAALTENFFMDSPPT